MKNYIRDKKVKKCYCYIKIIYCRRYKRTKSFINIIKLLFYYTNTVIIKIFFFIFNT